MVFFFAPGLFLFQLTPAFSQDATATKPLLVYRQRNFAFGVLAKNPFNKFSRHFSMTHSAFLFISPRARSQAHALMDTLLTAEGTHTSTTALAYLCVKPRLLLCLMFAPKMSIYFTNTYAQTTIFLSKQCTCVHFLDVLFF